MSPIRNHLIVLENTLKKTDKIIIIIIIVIRIDFEEQHKT